MENKAKVLPKCHHLVDDRVSDKDQANKELAQLIQNIKTYKEGTIRVIDTFKGVCKLTHLHIWEDQVKMFYYPNIPSMVKETVERNFKIPSFETILYINDLCPQNLHNGLVLTVDRLLFVDEQLRGISMRWENIDHMECKNRIFYFFLKSGKSVNFSVDYTDHVNKLTQIVDVLIGIHAEERNHLSKFGAKCPNCGHIIDAKYIKEEVHDISNLGKAAFVAAKIGGHMLASPISGFIGSIGGTSAHIAASKYINGGIDGFIDDIRESQKTRIRYIECPYCGHTFDF